MECSCPPVLQGNRRVSRAWSQSQAVRGRLPASAHQEPACPPHCHVCPQAELATSHKCLHHEVKRLNEENQGLRAEHLPSSVPQSLEQLEGEDESLPSSVQELQQLLHRTRQEARARLQAREHEAERLRIEIVNLREALEEETAARASLEGQLR
ncbi:rab GTPase-binding effector protein 2-like, partial [Ictidomys tridecemlineatus]|uniref:rab GTPase-binding effector protein 2-like n=1 Tax=Ictidomys tridecemlineatus TaxID=43179 RepID=UPI000B53FDAD